MAKRQTGGKSEKGKTDKTNYEYNEFARLQEAYNFLQREFLDLKKIFIGNEQQKLEMEEQYLLLRQSYEDLQIQSQEQQAKLIGNLEKSYDAYNEKFMKVEELEKQLDQCNKNLSEINQQNENKASSIQDQRNQVNFKRKVFEEAVQSSLANVGLTLVAENDCLEVKLLDYKRLQQLLPGCNKDTHVNSTTKDKKLASLEQANAFLQQTLLSLRDFSEKQQEELSRTTNVLQKRTEECVNLRKGFKGQGEGTVLVHKKTLQSIVHSLSEMSDFVVGLKKTICDQNSWIDMLVEALSEYKKSQLSKEDTNRAAVSDVSSPAKNKVLGSNGANRPSNSGQNSADGRKKKSKKKTRDAGHKVEDKPPDNCSGAASGNASTVSLTEHRTGHPSEVLPSSAMEDNEKLEEFGDFIVVHSKGPSGLSQGIRMDNSISGQSDAQSPFLSLQPEIRPLNNRGPMSLHHQVQQMSVSSMNNGRGTWEHFSSADLAGQNYQAPDNDASWKEQVSDEMCPICDKSFDRTCDLNERRSHINSHFEN